MYKPIEDALDAALKAGRKPVEIHLGAHHLRGFRAHAATYMSGGAATRGPSESYNDIPIVEDITYENRLAILCSDGHKLVID
jgi:hypothetical protein